MEKKRMCITVVYRYTNNGIIREEHRSFCKRVPRILYQDLPAAVFVDNKRYSCYWEELIVTITEEQYRELGEYIDRIWKSIIDRVDSPINAVKDLAEKLGITENYTVIKRGEYLRIVYTP